VGRQAGVGATGKNAEDVEKRKRESFAVCINAPGPGVVEDGWVALSPTPSVPSYRETYARSRDGRDIMVDLLVVSREDSLRLDTERSGIDRLGEDSAALK